MVNLIKIVYIIALTNSLNLDEALDNLFTEEALKIGLIELKGHPATSIFISPKINNLPFHFLL